MVTTTIYGLASVTWQTEDMYGQMGVPSVMQAGPKDNQQAQNIGSVEKLHFFG